MSAKRKVNNMFKRFRRLRINENLRALVQETNLSSNDFIYPLFVREGKNIKTEVASMPGVYQMSIDEILKECEYLVSDVFSGYSKAVKVVNKFRKEKGLGVGLKYWGN